MKRPREILNGVVHWTDGKWPARSDDPEWLKILDGAGLKHDGRGRVSEEERRRYFAEIGAYYGRDIEREMRGPRKTTAQLRKELGLDRPEATCPPT